MNTIRLIGSLLTLSLLSFEPTYANEGTLSAGSYGYDDSEELIPLCGGEGQDDCLGSSAIFEGSAIGECPAGSTFNLFTWSCHTCPDGYTLSAEGGLDPDSDRACHKRTGNHTGLASVPNESDYIQTKTKPATTYGTVCPSGTFYDPIRDGECWSCPSQFDRNWLPSHIDGKAACVLVGEFKKAINHAYGKGAFGRGTDCPSGQFWDGFDGRCHSCPSGFKRTTSPINSDRACGKPGDLELIAKTKSDAALATYKASVTSARTQKAKDAALKIYTDSITAEADRLSDDPLYTSANLEEEDPACEDGQKVDAFLDIGQGGTCYTCPETYRRTIAPLSDSKACDAPETIDYQYASVLTELTCPAGQYFDFINWQHKRVVGRTKGFDLDKSNTAGGTCWSCPGLSVSAGRSVAAVYEPDACVAPDIRWELPEWTSPGVYGRYENLAGVDLASELIAERTMINSIIEQLWNADKKKSNSKKLFKNLSLAELKAEMWEEILISPETSGVLRLALKSTLVRTALGDTNGLPSSSQKFLTAFETAVTQYRTFLVKQSKDAFEIWDERAVERDVYKSNQTAGETLEKAFFVSIGMPWPPQSVPDFRSEAEELTLELQTTETALKMAAVSENLPASFRNKILPVSYVKPTPKRGDELADEEDARDHLHGEIQGASEATIEQALLRLSLQTATLTSDLASPFPAVEPNPFSGGVVDKPITWQARAIEARIKQAEDLRAKAYSDWTKALSKSDKAYKTMNDRKADEATKARAQADFDSARETIDESNKTMIEANNSIAKAKDESIQARMDEFGAKKARATEARARARGNLSEAEKLLNSESIDSTARTKANRTIVRANRAIEKADDAIAEANKILNEARAESKAIAKEEAIRKAANPNLDLANPEFPEPEALPEPVPKSEIVHVRTTPGGVDPNAARRLGRVGVETIESGAKEVASAMLEFAKFAEGPLLAIDVVLTIEDVWGEVIIDRATMSKQYDNVLDLMKQPYSVRAALDSNSSAGEFDLYVNVVMNNKADDDIPVIVPSAEWVTSVCPQGQLAFGASGGAVCIHNENQSLSVPLF